MVYDSRHPAHDVSVIWRTHDSATASLLQQAAIRYDWALRISSFSTDLTALFAHFDLTWTPENETRLRRRLLDEARLLIEYVHSLLDPDTSDADHAKVTAVAARLVDISAIQVTPAVLDEEQGTLSSRHWPALHQR